MIELKPTRSRAWEITWRSHELWLIYIIMQILSYAQFNSKETSTVHEPSWTPESEFIAAVQSRSANQITHMSPDLTSRRRKPAIGRISVSSMKLLEVLRIFGGWLKLRLDDQDCRRRPGKVKIITTQRKRAIDCVSFLFHFSSPDA